MLPEGRFAPNVHRALEKAGPLQRRRGCGQKNRRGREAADKPDREGSLFLSLHADPNLSVRVSGQEQ